MENKGHGETQLPRDRGPEHQQAAGALRQPVRVERGGYPVGITRVKENQERARSGSLQMEMRPVSPSAEERRGSFDPRMASFLRDTQRHFEEDRMVTQEGDGVRRSYDGPYQGGETRDRRPHEESRNRCEEERRGSLPRARGEVGRKVERPKTNKELFDEAIDQNKSLLELPIPLSQKREFLRQHGGNILNLRENTIKKRVKAFRTKLELFMNQVYEKIEPWTEETKFIEGSFGTGVGSYFRLLRTFLYINLSIFMVTFVFLILPIISDGDITKFSTDASKEVGFQVSDIFLGNGYFRTTSLFYSFYGFNQFNKTASGWFPNYDIALGYFWVTVAGYVILIWSVLASFVSAYKKTFIMNAELEGQQFGTTVFTSWQMSVSDRSTARMLKNKIWEDLVKLLKYKTEKRKDRKADEKKRRNRLLLPRLALLLVIIAAFAGILYGFHVLLEFNEDEVLKHVYIIPLLLSFTVVTLPFILKLLNKIVGQYSERSDLTMRLVLSSLFIGASVLLIRIYWTEKTDEILYTETIIGQEMYRLVIFYFLIIILLNLVMETVNSVLYYKLGFKFLPEPEFDISRNTTNLIYCQLVTGLGYYYSPLLPLITSLILIVTFYLQYFLSLRVNLVSAKKTWISARTRTLYMVISFLAALVSVVFYLMAVTNTDIVFKYGPFPEGDPPIYSSGLVTKDKSVSFWIFNAPVWAGVAVATVVIYYYTWTLLTEQRSLKRRLRKELQKSKQEIKLLLKDPSLKKILND